MGCRVDSFWLSSSFPRVFSLFLSTIFFNQLGFLFSKHTCKSLVKSQIHLWASDSTCYLLHSPVTTTSTFLLSTASCCSSTGTSSGRGEAKCRLCLFKLFHNVYFRNCFFFSCPLGSDSQALGDAEAPVVTTTTPLNVDQAFGDVIYQETTGGVVYDFLQVHVKEPLLRRMLWFSLDKTNIFFSCIKWLMYCSQTEQC